MKLVDVVEWRSQERDVFAWHFPETNLSTYTQLIVSESQEAVLFKDGQMLGKFGPGRHTLDTKNLPILSKLYGFPFGGKNPFVAEVWYVSKIQLRNLDFSTPSFRYHDPDYKTMVPLIARGRYGIQVADSEKFLKKLVGTSNRFTSHDITDHFQGEISSDVTSAISGHMQADTIGIKAVSGYLSKLSAILREDLKPVWGEYGFDLISFNLSSVDIDESRKEGQEILEAMAQQSAQSIAGYTWQQKQTFDVAGKALGGGTEMGILGAMMMAGGGLFGGNGNGVANAAMAPVASTAGADAKSSGQMTKESMARMVFCSKCSRKYPSTSKFCPYCGNAYNPCPQCGEDNDEKAVRCYKCGKTLIQSEGEVCPKCGHPIVAGAAFCSNCGASAQKTCPRCNSPVKAGAAFCPSCGKKL